jgi:hypothetical protein
MISTANHEEKCGQYWDTIFLPFPKFCLKYLARGSSSRKARDRSSYWTAKGWKSWPAGEESWLKENAGMGYEIRQGIEIDIFRFEIKKFYGPCDAKPPLKNSPTAESRNALASEDY